MGQEVRMSHIAVMYTQGGDMRRLARRLRRSFKGLVSLRGRYATCLSRLLPYGSRSNY
jgi:hypothetical protein